jgi:hypothetical protein
MKQTIRVERLLRESVETPYCDLVTRSTGRLVRTSIQQAMAAGESRVTLLDFSEVGLVDLSCADEVIAKLLLEAPGERYLVLQGLREEQLEAIEHVLVHHDLAALVLDQVGGNSRPVGRVTPDLHTAFLTLQTGGPATAGTLAERTGWTPAYAIELLEALRRLRLVQIEGDSYRVPLDT